MEEFLLSIVRRRDPILPVPQRVHERVLGLASPAARLHDGVTDRCGSWDGTRLWRRPRAPRGLVFERFLEDARPSLDLDEQAQFSSRYRQIGEGAEELDPLSRTGSRGCGTRRSRRSARRRAAAARQHRTIVGNLLAFEVCVISVSQHVGNVKDAPLHNGSAGHCLPVIFGGWVDKISRRLGPYSWSQPARTVRSRASTKALFRLTSCDGVFDEHIERWLRARTQDLPLSPKHLASRG